MNDEKREKATESVKKRYSIAALFYDFLEKNTAGSNEAKMRQVAWSKIEGSNILEVGIGTGGNLPYYPQEVNITGIDFSESMLNRANDKCKNFNIPIHLILMDIQNMEFPDNTFDTVIGTFIFCTVPDPIRGLTEVRRVLKPNNRFLCF